MLRISFEQGALLADFCDFFLEGEVLLLLFGCVLIEKGQNFENGGYFLSQIIDVRFELFHFFAALLLGLVVLVVVAFAPLGGLPSAEGLRVLVGADGGLSGAALVELFRYLINIR